MPVEWGNLFGVNFASSNSNAGKAKAEPSASSDGSGGQMQRRLTAKEHWKAQPGHRYTPEELKRMSKAGDVTIQRRKRVVMEI